jgi:transcriptional regulator with XRE-family HTH domain
MQTSVKDLGKKLTEVRESNGFSKNQVAKISGLSMRQIINIESGLGYNVSSLYKYLKAINCTELSIN